MCAKHKKPLGARCGCVCHIAAGERKRQPLLLDPIAAATACSRCVWDHEDPFIPDPPWPRHTFGDGSDDSD